MARSRFFTRGLRGVARLAAVAGLCDRPCNGRGAADRGSRRCSDRGSESEPGGGRGVLPEEARATGRKQSDARSDDQGSRRDRPAVPHGRHVDRGEEARRDARSRRLLSAAGAARRRLARTADLDRDRRPRSGVSTTRTTDKKRKARLTPVRARTSAYGDGASRRGHAHEHLGRRNRRDADGNGRGDTWYDDWSVRTVPRRAPSSTAVSTHFGATICPSYAGCS